MTELADPPQREEYVSEGAYTLAIRRWHGQVIYALDVWMRTHFHVEFKALISTSPRGMWLVSLEGDDVWQARAPDFHKAVYELLLLLED